MIIPMEPPKYADDNNFMCNMIEASKVHYFVAV